MYYFVNFNTTGMKQQHLTIWGEGLNFSPWGKQWSHTTDCLKKVGEYVQFWVRKVWEYPFSKKKNTLYLWKKTQRTHSSGTNTHAVGVRPKSIQNWVIIWLRSHRMSQNHSIWTVCTAQCCPILCGFSHYYPVPPGWANRAWKSNNFCLTVICQTHIILSKVALTMLVSFLHHGKRLCFGDSNKARLDST